MASLEDDDSFANYVPTTTDPGSTLLIATCLFCVLSNLMLPCIVSLGRRYEKKRIAEQGPAEEDDVMSEQPQNGIKPGENGHRMNLHNGEATPSEIRREQNDDAVSIAPSSYVHGSLISARSQPSTMKSLLDKLIMPPYPDDADASIIGGGAFSGVRQRTEVHSTVSGVSAGVMSTVTVTSNLSKASTSILDTGRSRGRATRRQRHVLMDPKTRKQEGELERLADVSSDDVLPTEKKKLMVKKAQTLLVGSADDMEPGMTASELVHARHEAKAASEVASRVSSRVSSRLTLGSGFRGRLRNRHGDGSNLSGASKRNVSPEPSVLGKLEDHVITPNDAADAHDPGNYLLGKGMEGDEEIDLCCGKHAWWQASMLAAGFDRLVVLSELDHEYRRILKLSVPYSISGLMNGILETISVALVAHYLGTESVAAYTLVELVLGLTSEFVGGIVAAEATLCSHAVGAKNYKLAGQYVQLSAIVYTICLIPNIAFWLVLLDDTIRWFGFNEETVEIGYQYGIVVLFHEWLVGISYAYHGLLDVNGHETWSTIISVAEDAADVVVVWIVLLFRQTTLQEIGLIHLGIGVVFFVFNCWFTVSMGWMNAYLEGIVGSCALSNRAALKNVLRTGLPLAFGYLLQYGEWEVLTIFAAALGPAEVAAWGILETLWGTFETLTEGIADGGEVRCAYHLGAGNPRMAQLSSYKTILLSVLSSFMFTSVFFILGEDIAIWLTPDPTLQLFIAKLLPLLGVGNIALTAGSVSWSLVGAQGRYRLATFIAFMTTWGITVPLSALFTYGLNFDLQGIAASVVIGYSVTCSALLYILLRSDWERLSKALVEQNGLESESDSDSSDEESEG